jgi:predicted nucleotidyltransferase
MMTLQEIRATLHEYLPKLRKKYGVKAIGVFGSYARGEAVPESDIDIIVEFSHPIGWEFVDLADELEEVLHHKVDIVIKNSLHPLIRNSVLSEVIYA